MGPTSILSMAASLNPQPEVGAKLNNKIGEHCLISYSIIFKYLVL